jgi:hypothetical protein
MKATTSLRNSIEDIRFGNRQSNDIAVVAKLVPISLCENPKNL